MKSLFTLLGARWFLTLLGTGALALLVWVLGPLVGFAGREPLASPGSRAILIGVLFGLWGTVQLVAVARSRWRNRRLLEQLAASPAPTPDPAKVASEEELQALRERFASAVATLKGAEFRRRLGGRWIYQLPWYLIIGPPGCGKTTALVNSGLRFPLAERLGQDAIQGIGGTRNCDWWFTDEAVLIDTAGRYTTQDSYEQVDSAAWQGFLALLKKYRPRRPINGVLVAVSLADLMQQGQTEHAAMARAIRQRVQELCRTFGIAIPVYLVFMKADLIAGFMEFFADLNQEGREQVWGLTFPYAPEQPPATRLADFPREREALAARLDQRLLARMEAEREPGKRALVFSFPRQFNALAETLEQFVQDTFAPSRFEIPPLLRGVYFTSGTQTGTPIDRVLSAFADNFGFTRQGPPPFKGTGKGFFLTRLLRDLIFVEADLAGLNPRLERRRTWLRLGAYAGLLGAVAIAVAGWTTSYYRNLDYVDRVSQRLVEIEALIDALPAEERNPIGLLPLLDAARTLPGGFADRGERIPLTLGLGLYQGHKLGTQAERAYGRILAKALLPRVILRLEEQISEAGGDPDYLYDALRVYLMLDSDAHFDAAVIQYWVGRDWQRSLPRETTAEQQESLRDHLSALFLRRPVPLPLDLDGQLVAEAREILNRTSLADRIYARLKTEGVGEEIIDFRISDAGGEFAKLVFSRRSGRPINEGVPALYTYEGYHQGFRKTSLRLIQATADEAWVLGPQAGFSPDSADAEQLLVAVRDRYLDDYIKAWDELLGDIDLVAVHDLHHAAEVARILADPEYSPLSRLLAAVARQTELDRTAEGSPATDQAPGKALDDFRQRVERYFDGKDQPVAEEAGPESRVTRHFAWLNDVVRGDDKRKAPLERVLLSLGQLQLHLSSVAAAAASGRGQLVAGESAEIRDTKTFAAQLPAPLSGWIGTLAQDSANIAAGGARAQLNNIWTAEILPFCREAIHDRYPFVAASNRETTLHDFGRVFGPGGLIETFFKSHLSPIVDSAQATWRWTDAAIGIPDEVLAQFQRAAVIREAYFLAGGPVPVIEFELQPQSLDPRVDQLILDLGGQILDYRHGPLRTQRLRWPPPDGPARARLAFTDASGGGPSLTEEGPWAWFRILDRSRLTATDQPELFKLGLTLAGLSAQLELRAISVRNPFNLDELRGFQCPGRL